jgi:hypothetical protein
VVAGGKLAYFKVMVWLKARGGEMRKEAKMAIHRNRAAVLVRIRFLLALFIMYQT